MRDNVWLPCAPGRPAAPGRSSGAEGCRHPGRGPGNSRSEGMGPRASPPLPSVPLAHSPRACRAQAPPFLSPPCAAHPHPRTLLPLPATAGPEGTGLERGRFQNPSSSFGCLCSRFLFGKSCRFWKVLGRDLPLHLTLTRSSVGDSHRGKSL